MALSPLQRLSRAVCAQLLSEDVSGLLHEWVAMTAAFEDSRFKAARSVGDLAGGNVGEKLQAVFAEPAVAHGGAGDQRPRRQDVLTRSRKTDLAWLLAVQGGRVGRGGSDQAVSQQRGRGDGVNF